MQNTDKTLEKWHLENAILNGNLSAVIFRRQKWNMYSSTKNHQYAEWKQNYNYHCISLGMYKYSTSICII